MAFLENVLSEHFETMGVICPCKKAGVKYRKQIIGLLLYGWTKRMSTEVKSRDENHKCRQFSILHRHKVYLREENR